MFVVDPVLTLVTRRTDGSVVNEGDMIESFRGEGAVFVRLSRMAVPGKSGKVVVRWPGSEGTREYYDSVFGLSVSTLFPCGCVTSMTSDCVHVEIGNAMSGILPESAS